MSTPQETPVFVRVNGGKLARFQVATSDCERARQAVIHHLRTNGPKPESAVLALIQHRNATQESHA
ncbi:MAG TPA: hypothetical protein DET46_06565 [Comamonadaceae bacterium]|nr:hypothetical protein [Comamonadaceae bacterium]